MKLGTGPAVVHQHWDRYMQVNILCQTWHWYKQVIIFCYYFTPNKGLVQAGHYLLLLFYTKQGTGTSRSLFFVIILHQTTGTSRSLFCYYFTSNLRLIQAGYYILLLFYTKPGTGTSRLLCYYFTPNPGLVQAGHYFMLLFYAKPGTGTSRSLFNVIILHQTWDWYKQVIILCYYFTPNLGLIQAGCYCSLHQTWDWYKQVVIVACTKPGIGTSRLLL